MLEQYQIHLANHGETEHTRRLQPEKELYPNVERWLKRRFRCFQTAIDKGLQHSRIDVVGLRDSGGVLIVLSPFGELP